MVFRNLLKPYFKNAMKLVGKPKVFRGKVRSCKLDRKL